MGIIYSVTAILSVGFNIIEGGFIQVGRTIEGFWSGRERLATAMGAYFVFNMSIPGLLIVSKKNLSLWSKLLLIIIFIISLLCVFRLGSRTQIVLAIMGVFVGIIYRLKSQNAISNFKFMAVLAILIFLGINYISIDLDAEYLSSLGRRLQESDNAGSAGGRTELWSKSIENLFEKPFGWSINEFGYSHNMWLDTARTGTVISMFLITVFTFFAVKNIVKALRVGKDAFFLNATILIFNIIIFLQFFVEPVFDSPLFQLFIFFCLIQGFINEYRNKQVMEYTSD
ncbi:MAG: O-antigen ligase family protein [Flagellimonas sp.]